MSFGLLAKLQITDFYTPHVVYTAPAGGSIAGILIANTQGIPLFYNLSLGVSNPPLPSDYIAVKKIAPPNNALGPSPYVVEKMPLSAGELIIISLFPAEDNESLYDTNTFAVNVRIFGVDQADLTTARYTY